mmetsp:Transcript_10987/g.41018  ORF Transcript_10987/g.41018 Transcript_10987/m.41018 type:complete len:309 (+) Transcript_10987:1325-2251(+)|eukprot:scaffold327_cov257-Pinguiococcus_pyrenoidosus.AAC.2
MSPPLKDLPLLQVGVRLCSRYPDIASGASPEQRTGHVQQDTGDPMCWAEPDVDVHGRVEAASHDHIRRVGVTRVVGVDGGGKLAHRVPDAFPVRISEALELLGPVCRQGRGIRGSLRDFAATLGGFRGSFARRRQLHTRARGFAFGGIPTTINPQGWALPERLDQALCTAPTRHLCLRSAQADPCLRIYLFAVDDKDVVSREFLTRLPRCSPSAFCDLWLGQKRRPCRRRCRKCPNCSLAGLGDHLLGCIRRSSQGGPAHGRFTHKRPTHSCPTISTGSRRDMRMGNGGGGALERPLRNGPSACAWRR